MVRRRDLLRSGIAAGAGGLGLTSVNTVSAAPAGDFVKADGTQLTVNGEPFYFNGTNNYRLTDPYTDRVDVDRDMQVYADRGINAIRTWAFCSGDGGHCVQPEPGVYSEPALQHLDYVVAKARENGIRLILPLTNYWSDYGGMQQYVDWVSSASTLGDFYTNSECRQLYKDWINTLLTRENTFTGVEYRNDPTVMMWELANEPRLKTEDTDSMTTDEIQQTMQTWIEDMSSYIKSIAPNQLVSTGMEGFYDQDRSSDNWRINGSHGTDFVDNHAISTVDVASIHLYPHHWPGMSLDDAVGWIKEHAIDANQTLNMPFYCGEFNIHDNNESVRPQYLDDWYTTMDDYDVDGALIWQLLSAETSSSDGFTVNPGDPSITEIDQFTATQRSKSGPGGGTGGPHADLTVKDPIPAGAKAEFNTAYSFDPDGSIASYDWKFGDGVSASGEEMFHVYGSAGDYDVELTVTDDSGNTSTDTETVTVENLPEGSFVVQGSGDALRDSNKEYHFAYQQISGDETLIAEVASFDGIKKVAQAGLLAMDDLTTSAPGGGICLTTMNGVEFLSAYDGGNMQRKRRTWDSENANVAPFWLKLERSGDTITGYYSADGSSWSQLSSKSINYAGDIYVGLFVSSNNPGELATARFDNVSGLSSWSSTDVGSVEVPGNTAAGSGTSSGNSDPTASISASDTSVLVGDTVSFDGSGSSDSDGSITSYEWAFGDGTTATGATVSHSFGSADTYTVSLTVTDDDGATAGDTVSVTVNNDSPPTQPTNLSVDATTTTSADLSWDASSDSETSVDYYNVYLDGVLDHQTSSTSTSVSGLSSGTSYQFGVSAVDTEGNESTTTTTSATTDSGNADPTASISASDTNVLVGDSVSFDGSGSSDSDGSIASYEWTFGDGTTATGATVSHSYGSADTYAVSLTVTDDDGATASDNLSVTVNNDSPPTQPTNLSADATTTSSVDLSWDASSDSETSVDYYKIYVDGSFDHQTSSTTTSVSGLSSGTSYQFGVSAVDTEGNESSQTTTSATTDGETSSSDTFTDSCDDLTKLASGSETSVLTTDSSNESYFERPDGSTDTGRICRTNTTADTNVVYGPGGELTDGTVEFHWHDIEGGDIRVEESTDGGSTWQSASTTRSDYGGIDGSWYHTEISINFTSGADRVRLVLTGGNTDWAGQIGNVQLDYTTDSGGTSDSTAPSAPSNLSVTGTSSSSVDVSWDAVSDSDSGLDHYDVYVDGSLDQQVAAGTTSATVADLSPDTSYTIGVSATDGAGNESATSTVSATTDASSDTTDYIATIDASSTTASVDERIELEAIDQTGDSRYPTELAWDFDDGTTATGWWHAHRYDAAGSYTVTLTATDDTGRTTTDEVTITVS